MIITEEKIKVTHEMMSQAGMTRGNQFGVPDGKDGLIWKDLFEMGDEDFDKIEQYFIRKFQVK